MSLTNKILWFDLAFNHKNKNKNVLLNIPQWYKQYWSELPLMAEWPIINKKNVPICIGPQKTLVYDINKEYHIKNTGKAGSEVTAVLFVIGLG